MKRLVFGALLLLAFTVNSTAAKQTGAQDSASLTRVSASRRTHYRGVAHHPRRHRRHHRHHGYQGHA
ncbi:MAG: hypothetical protein JOY93_04930 [Acidobacteriales bacterium]|nr:hypothetical protein [Terriglobales bacterium]